MSLNSHCHQGGQFVVCSGKSFGDNRRIIGNIQVTSSADKRNDTNTQARYEYCKRGNHGKIGRHLEQG